jgi:DNA (cytosine-5)-methyltransferase 1
MWSGVDPDVALFASGIVKDDEGDWGTGGQPLFTTTEAPAAATAAQDKDGGKAAAGSSKKASKKEAAAAAKAAKAAKAAGGSSKAAAAAPDAAAAAEGDEAAAPAAAAPAVVEEADPVAEGGMRMFLSQIREWVVEYSADMLFISIRTDAAWYKLCRCALVWRGWWWWWWLVRYTRAHPVPCAHTRPVPATSSTHAHRPNPKYAPWLSVPLKSARVAVSVINQLEQQARASRLSFADVVKRIAEQPPCSSIHISKRVR